MSHNENEIALARMKIFISLKPWLCTNNSGRQLPVSKDEAHKIKTGMINKRKGIWKVKTYNKME